MSKINKKVTEYSFDIPIFNQKIKILIGTQEIVNVGFQKRNIDADISEDSDAACFTTYEGIYIGLSPNLNISTVVHEAGHGAFAIMKSRGLDIADEEVFCYLQEFIVNNILKCVKVTLPTVMDRINQKLKQVVEQQSF